MEDEVISIGPIRLRWREPIALATEAHPFELTPKAKYYTARLNARLKVLSIVQYCPL